MSFGGSCHLNTHNKSRVHCYFDPYSLTLISTEEGDLTVCCGFECLCGRALTFNPAINMKSLLKTILVIALLATWVHVRADDTYNNYAADIHLNESHQLRAPEPVIRYVDGESGVLLKSILEPIRVRGMLAIYWQQAKQGMNPSNLPQLLAPIINRYEKAFEARGSAYESEYLDSVEITSMMTASSLMMMNNTPLPAPNNKDGSKQSVDQVKLANTLNSMVKGVADLLTAVNHQLAAALRKKVEAGKFSPEGAKRALKIADLFSSPQ